MKPRLRLLLEGAALVLVVWGLYWPARDAPFAFDDWHVISQNPAIRDPADIPRFYTDIETFSLLPANRDYRPLFLTSMSLAWNAGEGAPRPFHLTGFALHTGVVLLLFATLRLGLTRRGAGSLGLEGGAREAAAFLAALLYAAHPMVSEAVIYVSSQSVPMAGLFLLLAFYLFLRVYAHGGGGASKVLLLVGSYAAYALGLLSKPIAFALPGILLLWELLFGAEREEVRKASPGRAARLLKHVPYLAISVAYLLIRQRVFTEPFGGTQPIRSRWVHTLTETKALVFYYLQLALAPFGLNVDREFPVSESLLDPWVIAALAVLAALGWLLFRLRRHRAVLFWALWFPGCLFITTYGVVLRQVVREARAYLALAGVCALAGLLFVKLWTSLPVRLSDSTLGRRSVRRLAAVAAAAVLVFFAWSTRARTAVWSSDLTLWQDAARKHGTWRAHMNYGLALEARGRKDEALLELKRAVEIAPYSWPHMNLGLAYVNRGRLDEGLDHLRTAVRLWPTSPEPHFYLAYGLEKQGEIVEAEAELREAMRLRGNYANAHRNLARLLEGQGRFDEAIEHYRRYAEIEPSQTWALNRLAWLQEGGGRDPERTPDALFSKAFALQKEGKRDEAIAAYDELLAIEPRHRQGTFNLAYAYLHGDPREDWLRAVDLFRRVLEIDPAYTESIHHLATLYWKLGDEELAVEQDRLYLETGQHTDLKERSRRRLEGASARQR